MLDLPAVQSRLAVACEQHGGKSAFARRLGVNRRMIADMIGGRCNPTQAVLDALGLRKVVSYAIDGPSLLPREAAE